MTWQDRRCDAGTREQIAARLFWFQMATTTAWQNRIVGYGEEPPDQLLAHPLNWRIHGKAQQDALSGVLTEVGVVQNVIVNRRNNTLIDGHLRVSLAMRQNQPTVPVTYVDLSPEEEALILATLDPISAMASSDADKLRELLDDVSTGDAAVMQMLSDLAESAGVVDFGATERLTDPDDVPEPPADPITQPGDLWLLGKHRLLCGDCRDPDDMRRLFGPDRANVVVTSPPYASQRKYDESSGFKPIHPDQYVEWFSTVAANIEQVLAPDGSYFLNIKPHCEDGERSLYVTDLLLAHARQWGWKFVDELCWIRRSYPGSAPNRFKNAWEPVYHFSRIATGIKFRPRQVLQDFKVDPARLKNYRENPHKPTGNDSPFEVGGKVSYEADGAWPDNVIEAFGNVGKDGHPAAFPVALPDFFIKAFSDPGDIVFDPFMGSGTTLIAADQNERIGYGMEISPAYCDVIIQRYEQFTGQTATRATDAMAAD